MKSSQKNDVNSTANLENNMIINQMQESFNRIEESLEELRISKIKSLSNDIVYLLDMKKTSYNIKTTPTEIVDMIKKCVEQNNIKLRKIKVDCFNKKNAKSALKEYIKLNSDEHDEEFKTMLGIIEEYTITYGYYN